MYCPNCKKPCIKQLGYMEYCTNCGAVTYLTYKYTAGIKINTTWNDNNDKQ